MNIEGKNPICINFMAVINQITTNVLCATLSDAVNKKHDEVHLLMSTPGGQVAEGISIYNFMCSLPIPIKTYNLGTIDSIGNVIFMAGKYRVSLPVSRFMFHGVGIDIEKARFELKDIRERGGSLENDQSMIADILVKDTNFAIEEVNQLFLEADYIRADKAHERGIVHEVTQISLPKDMPIISLIFGR